MKKLTLIISLVVVLGVGFLIFNSLSSKNGSLPPPLPENSVDTSNWKTYRNEQYGFEVKYPNEWFINLSGSSQLTPFAVSFSNSENIEIPVPGINPEKEVKIVIYKGSENLDDYYKKYAVGIVKSRTEIMIDNQRSILYESDTTINSPQYSYSPSIKISSRPAYYLEAIIKKGESIFLLESLTANEIIYPEIREIFNKMIATFKFI